MKLFFIKCQACQDGSHDITVMPRACWLLGCELAAIGRKVKMSFSLAPFSKMFCTHRRQGGLQTQFTTERACQRHAGGVQKAKVLFLAEPIPHRHDRK